MLAIELTYPPIEPSVLAMASLVLMLQMKTLFCKGYMSIPASYKSTLSMLLEKYLKPLGAKKFGADGAAYLVQLRPNELGTINPLAYVFNPLLYRLSYQAKTGNYK